MNLSAFKEIFNQFVKDVGDGLIATDTVDRSTGTSLMGVNSKPEASALFTRLCNYLDDTLGKSGFPPISRYFVMDLGDLTCCIVYLDDKTMQGMLVDTQKTQIGLLINVIFPQYIKDFKEKVISS